MPSTVSDAMFILDAACTAGQGARTAEVVRNSRLGSRLVDAENTTKQPNLPDVQDCFIICAHSGNFMFSTVRLGSVAHSGRGLGAREESAQARAAH
jgi:hypothetical protein